MFIVEINGLRIMIKNGRVDDVSELFALRASREDIASLLLLLICFVAIRHSPLMNFCALRVSKKLRSVCSSLVLEYA